MDEEWIEWDGTGEVPIKEGDAFERKYRDGEVQSFESARGHSCWPQVWEHGGDVDDIVAYRLVRK